MGYNKWLFCFILLAGMPLAGFGQVYFPEDMVKVSAQVLDDLSGLPVPYANVINQRVRGGTITEKKGNSRYRQILRIRYRSNQSDTSTSGYR